ncbi:MAG: toll/interleukin-1 receptor domain-containing protein [Bosea sp. (in: a-proteobacteria)]
MADIFISYKSERRKAVQHLAEILKINGYTVWFDAGLHSGVDFSAQIEKELEASLVVITLWCKLSVTSEWVKEEAHYAKNKNKAIPALIEPVELPFGFGLSDTINLAKWDGSPRSEALDRLFQQIAQKTNKKRQPDMEALTLFEEPWRRYGSPTLAQFALINDDAAQEAERARSGLAKLTARMGKPKEPGSPLASKQVAASGGISPVVIGGSVAALAAIGAGLFFALKPAPLVQAPSAAVPAPAAQIAPVVVPPVQPVAVTPPAPARPAGVLVMADDGPPETLSRGNAIVRRINRELAQSLSASRLRAFDEASMLAGYLEQPRGDASLADIRTALGDRASEIDAVLLVRTYADLERIPLAPSMSRPKLRIVGRVFSLATGQSLGTVEPAFGSIPPVPGNCDQTCLLDAVGTELRVATADLARFAAEKATAK